MGNESAEHKLSSGASMLARTPRWIIALTLVLVLQGLALAYDLCGLPGSYRVTYALTVLAGVAVFCAGAVQRLNWKHGLLLAVCYGIGQGLSLTLDRTGVTGMEGYHPYRSLIHGSLLIWLAGLGEMLTTGKRSLRLGGWLLLAAVSANGLAQIGLSIPTWADWTWRTYNDEGGYTVRAVAPLLYWPVMALAAWGGLGVAFAAASRNARAIGLACGAFVLALAGHAAFFTYGSLALARMSLGRGRPISNDIAILLLEHRGRPEDFDLILRRLCDADWTRPDDESLGPDWRGTAVRALSRHEEPAAKASEAFATMLRKRRLRPLASHTAELIVRHGHADVLPILLRYALDFTPGTAHNACGAALEQLGLPEAGIRLLALSSVQDRPRSRPADWDISAGRRRALADLLGRDVGVRYSAWEKAVGNAVDRHPYPLPKAIRKEYDRELACHEKWTDAFGRWREARALLFRKRLTAAGKGEHLHDLDEFMRKAGDRPVPSMMPPNVNRAVAEDCIAFLESATKDMTVTYPNVEAPTVDEYEKEVQAYTVRVGKAIYDKLLAGPAPKDGGKVRPAWIRVDKGTPDQIKKAVLSYVKCVKEVTPRPCRVEIARHPDGFATVTFPDGILPNQFLNLVGWLDNPPDVKGPAGAAGWITSRGSGLRYSFRPERQNQYGDTLLGASADGKPVQYYLPFGGMCALSRPVAPVPEPDPAPAISRDVVRFTVLLDVPPSFGNPGLEITHPKNTDWNKHPVPREPQAE